MSKENHLQPPLGICRRIFNFIVNEVLARRLKRVPLGSRLSRPSEDEKARLWDRDGLMHGSDYEAIKVQFKVAEDNELVDWTAMNYEMLGGPLAGGRGGLPPQLSKGKRVLIPLSSAGPVKSPTTNDTGPELAKRNGRGPQGMEPNLGLVRGPRRRISFKDSSEEEKAARKGKNTVVATATDVSTEVEMKLPGEPRVRKPINLLAQNINEKSDSFIKRRKEIMRRHLSMELKER